MCPPQIDRENKKEEDYVGKIQRTIYQNGPIC